jgi:endonuclease YncB( thermonuclease family)
MMTSVGEKIKVRLLGVDAPEVAHGGDTADCGADAAHDALEELLSEGTSVDVVFDLRADRYDRYGRALGYVSTDVVDDVALRLLDAGLVEAWIPAGEPQPERFAEYREAQSRAQDAGVGAWVGCDTLGR